MSCAQVPHLILPCELWWRPRDERAGWCHKFTAFSAGASAKAGEIGQIWLGQVKVVSLS